MQQFHRTKTTDRCDFEGQTRSHSLRTPFTFSNRAIIGFVLMRNHNKTSQKEYDLKEINDIAKQTCKCLYLYTNIIQTKNIYYQQTVGTAFHVSVPVNGSDAFEERLRLFFFPGILGSYSQITEPHQNQRHTRRLISKTQVATWEEDGLQGKPLQYTSGWRPERSLLRSMPVNSLNKGRIGKKWASKLTAKHTTQH